MIVTGKWQGIMSECGGWLEDRGGFPRFMGCVFKVHIRQERL